MFDPEQEFEYEQKCERIAMEIEMMVIDGIVAALGKLKYYLQEDDRRTPKTSEEGELF
jgi:hypothetical protein